MKKDFDFGRIGKRMPYTVPRNFFDEMEGNVWEKVRNGSAALRKRRAFRLRIVIGAAAAAAVALLLLVPDTHVSRERSGGLVEVEQAFNSLAGEDRAYILQVYQDDLFMNE